MNHVYRVIWNRSAACWQAVSETARGQSKSSKSSAKVLKQLAAIASIAVSSMATAAPTGGVVTSGTASIGVSGSTTTINQSTAKAIINWNDFSIANGETVNFVQPDANAIALNRVVTATPSSIQGALNANGQVFIVNPNGITFGSTAQVNVGGLVASTLDISDSDFNNGTYRFANSSNNASITNQANITVADAGTAALIAPSIQQAGSIISKDGSILLAAATDVSLNLTDRTLNSHTVNAGHKNAVINHSAGVLQADGGNVVLTAQGVNSNSSASINSMGIIKAQTLAGNNRGSIQLTTDTRSGVIHIGGTLDASAPIGGFGGSINTTAADIQVTDSASVTTRKMSQNTLPGSSSGWQIKANNITVGASGTISGSKLGSSLNEGSVSLISNGSVTGKGSININEAVSSNANSILTLSARRDVNINKDVSLSGSLGKLILKYGASNDYNLNHGSKINLSGANAGLQLNGVNYIVINSLGVADDSSTTTLQGIKNNLAGNYALGSNIDASATSSWSGGKGLEPIGSAIGAQIPGSGLLIIAVTPFSGQFHGLGHEISDLNIGTRTGNFSVGHQGIGLFGILSGMLRNTHLTNVSINTNGLAAGGLAGIIGGKGIIKNSSASGAVSSENFFAGGLVGIDADQLSKLSSFPLPTELLSGSTTISQSSYKGVVSTTNIYNTGAIGGLMGSGAGKIQNSYAIATLLAYGSGISVGGIIGKLNGTGKLENTYSQIITNDPSSRPQLSGRSEVGSSIDNSFWDTAIYDSYWGFPSPTPYTNESGIDKTTAELKQIATFTGWDIADVSNTTSNSTWVIDENNATPWLR